MLENLLHVLVFKPCCILSYAQSDEGGRAHVSDHRQQRGGDHLPQHALLGVGHRGTGEPASQLVLLLQQHRGESKIRPETESPNSLWALVH